MNTLCTAIIAGLLAASPASAAVVTFDDLPTPSIGASSVPNGYAGLNWQNVAYVDAFANNFGPSGYHDGVVSAPNVGLMANDIASVVVTGAEFTLFDFKSAYLNAAYLEDLSIQVRGYRAGVLLYDRTVVVDPYAPTFFTFDYLGIDELRFDTSGGTVSTYGDHGKFFAMDNLTITEAADTDGDGVPDTADACVDSVLGGQVDVGSGPTSIANDGVDADGCSIQDLVNECAAQAADHGDYVSAITELGEDLEAAGVISKQQGNEMKIGAARSKIGK